MFVGTPQVWQIGALCRAIADALDARFNPVTVRAEISGFSRASSGHCYFSLKDESGQIRCAMFRRIAMMMDFAPRDGELVEVRGRLGMYESRGDLQLIVESMSRAGQGVLFERFLALKSKLAGEGLFEATRKRSLPRMPRGIGVVTSLGSAALHDVATALQRRVPHIPVVVASASVQGGSAPQELIRALQDLYALTPSVGRISSDKGVERGRAHATVVDVILLVRGGGSMEDLWGFNDEQLARVVASSPVPIVSGVGHETDFTIADFVADLRAPTPTAAAELVADTRELELAALEDRGRGFREAVLQQLDQHNQRLDLTAARLGRPSPLVGQQRLRLASAAQQMHYAELRYLTQRRQDLQRSQLNLPEFARRGLDRKQDRVQRAALQLGLLNPALVLQRGYAWLSNDRGQVISSVSQTYPDQRVRAILADGEVDLTVSPSI